MRIVEPDEFDAADFVAYLLEHAGPVATNAVRTWGKAYGQSRGVTQRVADELTNPKHEAVKVYPGEWSKR